MRRLLSIIAATVALAVPAALAQAAPAKSPAATAAAAPTRFTVEVRGSTGPDVILIPGLTSSRDVWAATAKALQGGHRLHLVQVRGFAGSEAGPNAEGPVLDGLVEELAAYIRANNLKAPAVIGHSMGGLTALLLAERHPDLVGRVMIVDALPFFGMLFGPTATAESLRPQAEQTRTLYQTMPAEQLAQVQTSTMQRLVKNEVGRAEALKWSLASDPRVVGQVTYEVMTTDVRPRLATVQTPVTVLYARDDAMGLMAASVDPLYQGAYAALPNKRLVRMDGAFHFIMFDQPEAFQREVETFLK